MSLPALVVPGLKIRTYLFIIINIQFFAHKLWSCPVISTLEKALIPIPSLRDHCIILIQALIAACLMFKTSYQLPPCHFLYEHWWKETSFKLELEGPIWKVFRPITQSETSDKKRCAFYLLQNVVLLHYPSRQKKALLLARQPFSNERLLLLNQWKATTLQIQKFPPMDSLFTAALCKRTSLCFVLRTCLSFTLDQVFQITVLCCSKETHVAGEISGFVCI